MKIILRRRLNNDYITLPSEILELIKSNEDKELTKTVLYNYLDNLAKTRPSTHDKTWMTMIVNWTPPQKQDGSGGLSMMEIAKWYNLAKTIDEVSEDEDTEIDLTEKQINMIFEKLRNPDFKIVKMTSSLMYFLHELEEMSGMKIATTESEGE